MNKVRKSRNSRIPVIIKKQKARVLKCCSCKIASSRNPSVNWAECTRIRYTHRKRKTTQSESIFSSLNMNLSWSRKKWERDYKMLSKTGITQRRTIVQACNWRIFSAVGKNSRMRAGKRFKESIDQSRESRSSKSKMGLLSSRMHTWRKECKL